MKNVKTQSSPDRFLPIEKRLQVDTLITLLKVLNEFHLTISGLPDEAGETVMVNYGSAVCFLTSSYECGEKVQPVNGDLQHV